MVESLGSDFLVQGVLSREVEHFLVHVLVCCVLFAKDTDQGVVVEVVGVADIWERHSQNFHFLLENDSVLGHFLLSEKLDGCFVSHVLVETDGVFGHAIEPIVPEHILHQILNFLRFLAQLSNMWSAFLLTVNNIIKVFQGPVFTEIHRAVYERDQ